MIAFTIYRSRMVKFVQDFDLAIVTPKVILCSSDFYMFLYDCPKNYTYTYIIVFIR